jgi:hypothetical protein
MRKLCVVGLLALLALLVGCGTPPAPVIDQISPATLTAPTYYENNDTQSFFLTGERFEPGATVLIGETEEQAESVTASSITVYVPPTLLNPEFPQNPAANISVSFRVKNSNGQISNAVMVTVVPHCNPCGT